MATAKVSAQASSDVSSVVKRSLEQVRAEKLRIDQEYEALLNDARDDALKTVMQLVQEFDFQPKQIFPSLVLGTVQRKTTSGSAVVKKVTEPMYRNKEGKTWGGGRGPVPGWVVAIKDAGGDIEQYRIQPSATVAPAPVQPT